MKLLKIVIAMCIAICGTVQTSALAQDSLLGKYSGAYTAKVSSGERRFGLFVIISSIEDGKVKGTADRAGVQCQGSFQLEGTIKDNQLVLRSNAGGASGDCRVNLRLVVEGDKLTGTMGNFAVSLSK